MKRLAVVILASLALNSVAIAEEGGSGGADKTKTDKVEGPPNASGAAKKDPPSQDKTGTGEGGAAAAKATGEDGSKK